MLLSLIGVTELGIIDDERNVDCLKVNEMIYVNEEIIFNVMYIS